MSDLYTQFTQLPGAGNLAARLGLPIPPDLRRHAEGDPLVVGPVLVGEALGGRLAAPVSGALRQLGVDVLDGDLPDGVRPAALVFDASGIRGSEELAALHDFFGPVARSLADNGRLLVLGTPPEDVDDVRFATAQRALEGFTRSMGKEVVGGSTAQLLYVGEGAEHCLDSTLRFLLSPRSAFVSAQVVRVLPTPEAIPAVDDLHRPLAGRTALVTGAARGIGASIAEVLARDGADVVCLDVPGAGDALSTVANRIGGTAFQLDLTSEDAPRRLADQLKQRHGGVDIVVHNAGITRDKTLARMSRQLWDSVLAVNLTAQERVDELLLEEDVLSSGGRIIGVSSMNGIAGQRGQTNYATSKAGVIGRVHALAPQLAPRGITVNAVAPGFIETQMTAAMPVGTREVGRRINSLSQGGQPVDVAETISWFAEPASAGVTGNVVRVDGQNLLGA